MTVPPVPLLFDLDGTLVDSALAIALALSAAADGVAPVDPERVRPLVSQGVGTLVGTILGSPDSRLADDIAEFRRQLVKLQANRADLYPGVAKCMTALQARGHPMAIVTNKPEVLARKLIADMRLDGHFGAIIGGDTCSVAKPDPAPLLHALEVLGAPRRGAVMIGDSAVDAKAADASRIRFVLFEGGYGAHECHEQPVWARFADFGELLPILDPLDAE